MGNIISRLLEEQFLKGVEKLNIDDEHRHEVQLDKGWVTPIRTVLTAKTGVKKFGLSLLPLDRTAKWHRNQPMTVDYMHILSFDPIIYSSEATPAPFLVYGSRCPVLAVNMAHMGVTIPCWTFICTSQLGQSCD